MDSLTGGLHYSGLTFLVGGPSVGKTSLALNIAEHVLLKDKIPLLFCSLESTAVKAMQRFASLKSGVQPIRVQNGRMLSGEQNELVQAYTELANKTFFIDDSSRSVFHISRLARSLQKEAEIKLVVIDYLELLDPTNRFQSRDDRFDEIVRQLKALAKELDVAILCLSQLAAKTSRSITLNDCNLSVAQHSDLVLILRRDDSTNVYMSD